jgi:two-component system, chemotaxis family, protein-glutamate methylesterase/glutaminase
LSGLPASFPGAIVLVQHMSPTHHTMLDRLLSHRSALLIKIAEECDLLTPGKVFIAPPNFHLLINQNQTLSLSGSAPVHYSRPSADVLFYSVAQCFHERAIAVILSGTGKDGSDGALEIHKQGGKVIAQDRTSATFYSMPESAILTGCVDYILPLNDIPAAILNLIHTGAII